MSLKRFSHSPDPNRDGSFTAVRPDRRAMLPEWGESEVDDAAWIAAIEESRRQQFAELADL